jgi:hypothetical protein
MQDNSSEQEQPQPGSPAGPEKPPADAAGEVADATETAQADQTPQADQSVATETADEVITGDQRSGPAGIYSAGPLASCREVDLAEREALFF